MLTSIMVGSTYFQSGYVAKYDATGQCLWAVPLTPAITGAVGNQGNAIAFDASNGGRLVATGWGSPSTTPGSTGQDGIIAWLNAATTLGGDGNIYVTYQVTGNSAYPSYVAKLNSTNGTIDQAITIAAPAAGLAVDSSGNIFVAGTFVGTNIDFDFTAGTWLLSAENGQAGMFVFKLHL